MDRELAGRLVEDNPDFTAFSANIPPARPVDNDPGTSAFGIPLPLAYGPPVTSVTAPARGVSVEYEATAQVRFCIAWNATHDRQPLPRGFRQSRIMGERSPS